MRMRMCEDLLQRCVALFALVAMGASAPALANGAVPDVPSTQHDMVFEDDEGDVFFRSQGTSSGNVLGDGTHVLISGHPDGDEAWQCVGGCVIASADVLQEIGDVMANWPTAVRTFHAPQPGDEFGAAVASGGDVNADGHDDILVGAPGAFGAKGRVYVYCGQTSNLLYTIEGEAIGDRFGASVAVIGDVTGDGVADFVVGAPHHSGVAQHAGRVYVYSGATGDLLLTLTGQEENARFGIALWGGRSELPPGVRPLHTIGPQWTITVGVDPAQGEAERKRLLFEFGFPYDPAAGPAPGAQSDAAPPGHCDEASFLIAMQEAVDDLAQAGVIDLGAISAQTFGEAMDEWRSTMQIGCPAGPASVSNICWTVQIGSCRFSWCELHQSIEDWRDGQLLPLDQIMKHHRNRLNDRRTICDRNFDIDVETAKRQFLECLQMNPHDLAHGLCCSLAQDQQIESARQARNACLAAANQQFFIDSSFVRQAIDDVWNEYHDRVRDANLHYLRCLLGFPGAGFGADDPPQIP